MAFRAGYVADDVGLHHFIQVSADDDLPGASLCGTWVDWADHRPLWKSAGEPCRHCSKEFSALKRGDATHE